MKFDIIATIEVETVRYNYILKNGKRDIDEKDSTKEILVFKFDSNALKQILFRTGDPVLFVDDKEMYFRYKDNKLAAIHFESNNNIWIVTSYKKFMDDCEQIYSKLKMLEMISDLNSTKIEPTVSKSKKQPILDEFDLPDGIMIKENETYEELDGNIIKCPECNTLINTAQLVDGDCCPYCYAYIDLSEEDYFDNK